MKKIYKYIIIFTIFIFSLITPLYSYASDYYFSYDISDLDNIIENSTYNTDLLNTIDLYCKKHNLYYFIGQQVVYGRETATKNTIYIFNGSSVNKILCHSFVFINNNFYEKDINCVFNSSDSIDINCVSSNYNFSLQELYTRYVFTDEELKEKYKTDNITNVSYNTTNNTSSIDNSETNQLLACIVLAFIYFGTIYIVFKITDYLVYIFNIFS